MKSIYLPADSQKEFFLIHGYTGGPHDFNELPYHLHRAFGATVRVNLLPGHGTRVEDLDNVSYEYFVNSVETALKAELAKGKKIVLGGISLGGQLALNLAGKYSVAGVFNVSTPYILKMPFSLPFIKLLGTYKKYWKKRLGPQETELRKNTIYYTRMHRNGLAMVYRANQELKNNLSSITCPVLTIQSKHDRIAKSSSIVAMEKRIGSIVKRHALFNTKNHNIFYSEKRQPAYDAIINFFNQCFILKIQK